MSILKHKKVLRPIQGFILSVGSPLGWMTIQVLSGIDPIDDMMTNTGIYIYTAIGTALAFSIFGYYVGSYEEKIEILALIDPLTGLANRNKFYLLANHELDRSSRYGDNLSLAVLDIDRFKKINDTYGHPIGDSVLKNIANTICTTLRKSDISVRWGGEEFLFLMPGTSLAESRVISERLRSNIEKGSYHEFANATASIGITEYIKGDSLETMIKRADDALYDAKATGRNRVSTSSPSGHRP